MKLANVGWLAPLLALAVAGQPACHGRVDLGSHGRSGGDGALTVLADGQIHPWTIVVDDRNVYWVNANPLGGVFSVPKGGGSVTTLYSGEMLELTRIALDATNVYFTRGQSIAAVAIGGGTTRTMASTFSIPRAVAVAGGNLYWVDAVDPASPDDGGIGPRNGTAMRKVPVSGGQPESVPFPVGTFITGDSFDTIVSGETVYATLDDPGVFAVPLDGSSSSYVPSTTMGVEIAADADNIYFANHDTVASVPRSGGALANLVATYNAVAIAVDGDYLYVADDTPTGRILRMTKTGDDVTVLADNQGAPGSIAVDETSVYWACINDGTIKKIGK